MFFIKFYIKVILISCFIFTTVIFANENIINNIDNLILEW